MCVMQPALPGLLQAIFRAQPRAHWNFTSVYRSKGYTLLSGYQVRAHIVLVLSVTWQERMLMQVQLLVWGDVRHFARPVWWQTVGSYFVHKVRKCLHSHCLHYRTCYLAWYTKYTEHTMLYSMVDINCHMSIVNHSTLTLDMCRK